VPPLRERDDDVVQLAQHFLEKTCKDFGRDSLSLTRTQAANLRAYNWPGNVRELKNVIERAVILSTGKVLRLDLSMPGLKLSSSTLAVAMGSRDEVLTETDMRDFQKNNIIRALDRADWKISGKGGAAELLGVRPTTLADRVRTHKIRKPVRRQRT
jgi:transcriptional regulator with GAF, ATPase, and Fis domain